MKNLKRFGNFIWSTKSKVRIKFISIKVEDIFEHWLPFSTEKIVYTSKHNRICDESYFLEKWILKKSDFRAAFHFHIFLSQNIIFLHLYLYLPNVFQCLFYDVRIRRPLHQFPWFLEYILGRPIERQWPNFFLKKKQYFTLKFTLKMKQSLIEYNIFV